MDFIDDGFLLETDDILTELCDVEFAVHGASVTADRMGLGGITAETTARYTLPCVKLPPTQRVEYSGEPKTSNLQLAINDPGQHIQPGRRIYYGGAPYIIESIQTTPASSVKIIILRQQF